eukprot:1330262-Ditylum_brightwellii.AAC.1
MWVENMINWVAVLDFKNGDDGNGILNHVDSVVDRLQEIEDGTATASQVDGSVIFLLVGAFVRILCCCKYSDSKYPMGENRFCKNCGQCNWTHQHWDEIAKLTYYTKGLKHQYPVEWRIVVGTIQAVGGGGSSDGGGGGGASW